MNLTFIIQIEKAGKEKVREMTFFSINSRKELNSKALNSWKKWKFWVWFSSYTSLSPVEVTPQDQAVGQDSGHGSQNDDEVERSFFRWLSSCVNYYLNAKILL